MGEWPDNGAARGRCLAGPGATAPTYRTTLAPPQERRFEPLERHLSRHVRLTPEESDAVEALTLNRRSALAEEILVHAGEPPEHASLILKGCAYRYKSLPDGHRQILGFLHPGDLCDVEFAEDDGPDHSVAALTGAVVAQIPLSQIVAIQARYPNIRRAFSLILAAERSSLRNWLLNIGQRSSLQRISYFLCEISSRLRAHGQIEHGAPVELPLSQAVLADTTGVTKNHINRILRQLRRDGLVELRRNQLTILDPVRLAQLTDFDEGYLFKERQSS